MSRLGTAFRSFAASLGSAAAAERLARALDDAADDAAENAPSAAVETPAETPESVKPARSEAITLLAALQREGRLVDFLQEPIDGFSDAQVGAAARDVHRGCRGVLERLVKVVPAIDASEGDRVRLSDFAAGAVQRIGGSGDEGELVHAGWRATETNLPDWTGDTAAADVIAPAEVQV